MNPSQVVLQGTLRPDGTVELDEKPNLPPGRVRVALQPAPGPTTPGQGWWEVLQQIWTEQAASGYRGRTKEEIDAGLDALRNEWEERLQDLGKIHEEAQRAREQPGC